MHSRSNYFGPLILSLILSVCFIPRPGESAEPIHLGVLHSEGYAYAEMMKNSFELAMEAINQEGGIKGRPLKLIYGNDRGKREPGEEVVKELVKKSGVVMLVGGYQSSNTIYTARVADRMNVPFIVSTAAGALRRAESLKPASIRAALDSTDMMTSFGPVKFSAYGKFERQNSLPTQVLQIIKGRFECVWPENLATSKFSPSRFWRGSD